MVARSMAAERDALDRDPTCSGRFVEFFAGVGLIHEALAPLGWTVALANDNDPKKELAYRTNFPDVPFSSANVQMLSGDDLPTAELATASFPCVDLSRAGGRRGIYEGQSSTVWAFLDRIRELRLQGRPPRYLLLENVPGLLSHSGGSIDALLEALSELGYGFDVVQVDAKHFTPQTRDRVYIICLFGVVAPSPWPAPQSAIRRYHVSRTHARRPELPWIYFNFPDVPTRRLELDAVIEPLPPDDSRWWSAERMEYFWARLERGHDVRLRMLMESGFNGYLTATRRGRRRGVREQIINLRFDRAAACLRTPKGGSSTQLIVEIEGRAIRVRRILGVEAGRLQGVGLSEQTSGFSLVGSDTDQLFAFGDAVCVPAVRWVVRHSIERLRAGEALAPVGQTALAIA